MAKKKKPLPEFEKVEFTKEELAILQSNWQYWITYEKFFSVTARYKNDFPLIRSSYVLVNSKKETTIFRLFVQMLHKIRIKLWDEFEMKQLSKEQMERIINDLTYNLVFQLRRGYPESFSNINYWEKNYTIEDFETEGFIWTKETEKTGAKKSSDITIFKRQQREKEENANAN